MTGAADSLFNFLITYTEFAVTDLYIEEEKKNQPYVPRSRTEDKPFLIRNYDLEFEWKQ